MSNFQAINANTIQLGETTGVCSVEPAPNRDRIKSQMDLVDSNGLNVIDYDQSTDTIDFNSKTITGFTGGGGGGGDVFLANTQTFTGVNTFSGNTILTTAATGNINTTGTIVASSTVTGSGLITSGTVECNKVESVGNVELATGDLEVTLGNATIGGTTNTSGLINTGDINTTTATATGDVIIGGDLAVTGQMVGNNGLTINSGTTTVGAISTNNVSTTGTIACNSTVTGASLEAAAGDITCAAGVVNGLTLQSSGGIINLKSGNARIEDDTNNDIRIQANANTDTVVCRLGATGADNLQLSYDSGTNKSVLKLYDFGAAAYYNVGGSPDDLAGLVASLQNTSMTFNPTTTITMQGSLVSTGITTLSGTAINLGTGTNTATITAMNDTADRLNVNAGKIQLDATATLAKTGTTSGATDIFTVTDTLVDRSATSFTPTLFTLVTGTPGAGQIQLAGAVTNSVQASIQAVRFGTNGGTAVYRVSCRGRLTGFTVANIGAGSGSIDLFTLPAGYRPTIEQNIISQGHPDEGQIRIDISTSGLVSIAEGASTNNAQFCNLGTIDIWAGI